MEQAPYSHPSTTAPSPSALPPDSLSTAKSRASSIGYPNFVNNDHCLLSARATINLNRMLPPHLAMLPMAQTIWYIPTGLDIWNQKLNRAPGHYTRQRGDSTAVEAPIDWYGPG